MTAIRNIFNRGAQDKDSDKSAVPNGMTRHVENLRFHTNNGKDGIGVNIKGTLKVSDVTKGNTDLKCIGAYFNEDKDVIYYKLASSDGMISIDAEYDVLNNTTSVVLKDTNGVLKYDKKGYITGWNEIDGLQFWSEWGNNPRRINTERAKTYGVDGFTEDDITVIVYPPLQKLKISLQNTNSITGANNIKEKLIFFSYRYRYLDGEYSVLAPFTEVAFTPKKFRYNFKEQSNEGMINRYNEVNIKFNTGSERVTEIQLVFKESGSEREWIIDNFDKSLLGYGHNEIKEFLFNNLKSKRALPNHIADSFFDNVPKTAKAQTMIEGRLIYGNYKENYNIIDDNGNKIEQKYFLNLLSEDNTEEYTSKGETLQRPTLIPKKTCRSNRDYEVKIAYIFDYGRLTTLLSSKDNTIFIPVENSIKKNVIQVEMPKEQKPPLGAKFFRFFIKQNKKNYDYVIPTLFYEDRNDLWFKIEGFDIDKIKEEDYLTVKIDSLGVKDSEVKVKVLEVGYKPKNFLGGNEFAGKYFKISSEKVDFQEKFLESYYLKTFHNSRGKYDDPVINDSPYTGDAHYYGQGTLNDLITTSRSNSYNGDEALRYKIVIDTNGAIDTFEYYINSVFILGNIAITGADQTLNHNVKIKFNAVTGHDNTDKWEFSVRRKVNDIDYRAYGFFRILGDKYKTMTSAGHVKEDERIENGSHIELTYDSYGKHPEKWSVNNLSSSVYDNIEEWYYKEDIKQEILNDIPNFFDSGKGDVYFVRGVLEKDNDGNATYIRQDEDGYMTMVIKSKPSTTYINNNEAHPIKVHAYSRMVQGDGSLLALFETQPTDQNKEIFHEIGRTYKIENGFHTNKTNDWETEIEHIATDRPQTTTQSLKVSLDWFNAWSYGNAVESYKIKDDFNSKSLDNGVRVLASIKEEYKEVHRTSDITWSDVYNDDNDFNGLNSFNLSLINFVKIDKEDGSIQKLFNANKNLLVYQEDAVGLMPYNRSVFQDVDGGKVVGISKNILNKDSYSPYADGLHGISLNPESFVSIGSRKYSTDRVRGDLLRLSINGITEINKYQFEHWFSDEMHKNKGEKLIGGYDPKHKEYYLFMPKTGTLVFTEKAKGFPFFLTIEPDFMLNANNEFYAWKNGVMYKMNATENRNNFFGKQYKSVLKFFVNTEYQTEKIFKALGLESTHAWLCNLKTNLTSRTIPKNSFVKKEDYFYSEIMGNTNSNTKANSIFGLGGYPIINGVITTKSIHNSLSVGDTISSKTLSLPVLQVVDIQGLDLVLSSPVNFPISFLMYHKNQNIDGSPIRGDILEIEMISDETEKTEIRAVRTEVVKSNYS